MKKALKIQALNEFRNKSSTNKTKVQKIKAKDLLTLFSKIGKAAVFPLNINMKLLQLIMIC
jgi:hypothetical protein